MQTQQSKKIYNQTEIFSALKTLRENQYNYRRTSTETLIARDTLRRWEKKYGKELDNEKTEIKTNEEPNTENNLQQIDEAISAAIKRTITLLPHCKNALEASNIAKNLVKIRTELTSKNESSNNNYSALQTTINILNKYEKQ